jgi:hypothetical protein
MWNQIEKPLQKRLDILKNIGGVEEGRTPDLCIANAPFAISENPPKAVKYSTITKFSSA